jgi:hypothetical protein
MAVCAYSEKVDMTQDEIIEMARQTGWHDALLDVSFVLPTLTDFAKLVAAKQRTWVGLTEKEQRDIAYSDINFWDWGELMDATEAKLKEKNGFAEDSLVTEQNICPKCRSFFCDNTCKVIAELESQEPVAWVDPTTLRHLKIGETK